MKIAQRLLIALLLLCDSVSLRAQLPLGPQFRVNHDPTADLMSPRVAINARGDFVVLWYGFGDSRGGILHARRFRPDGQPATGDIRVADQIVNNNENVDVAIQDDGSFLAIFSVSGALKLRRFAPDGTLLLEEQMASDSPYVPSASISARSDGRFVVAWSLFSGEVSARVLSPDGIPLGPVVTVDTASGVDFGARVAMGPKGDFVVVWRTFLGGDPSGRLLGNIQAQRYGPGGRPRGGKILVSDHFGGITHVAKDGAGNFLVVWSELPGTSGLQGIYGRRVSAAGVPLGAAMPLVPTFTTGYAALAMAPDGSFVLAWELHDQDIYAQVFAADGVPPRPAFPAPQVVSGMQRYPRVAIDGMGRFVVVWEDGGDLFGRLFKARRP
jgi:hypothetical protein